MSGVIGGIIGALLFFWLASRARKKEAVIQSGRFVLKYGRLMKVLSWIGAFFGVLIFYAAVQSVNDPIIGPCVGVALFALFLYFWVECHFVRIEFDEEFIYTFSPWRRSRVIPWNEVIGHGYSAMGGWHILKTQKFGSIRLSELLSGLGTMMGQLEKRGLVKKELFR